jgi:hypothetical protein
MKTSGLAIVWPYAPRGLAAIAVTPSALFLPDASSPHSAWCAGLSMWPYFPCLYFHTFEQYAYLANTRRNIVDLADDLFKAEFEAEATEWTRKSYPASVGMNYESLQGTC